MKKVFYDFKQYFPSLLTKVIIILICVTGMMLLVQGCSSPDNNDGNTNTDDPNNENPPELLPFARVSVNNDGVQADNYSYRASLNANGSLVAFYSKANNLAANDTNSMEDIYVYNRETKKLSLISTAINGQAGNGYSSMPVISANGRYVAYQSTATNLITNDANRGVSDIFVYDRQLDITMLASVSSKGEQGDKTSRNPVISADGHFVAFESMATNLVEGDTNELYDIFVFNTQTGQTDRVSVASTVDGIPGEQAQNGDSSWPAISADGQIVAFYSLANNLVKDDNLGATDIFVHDRTSGATERVSLGMGGQEANANSSYPSISADGQLVAFESLATNLVPGDVNVLADIFVYDRQHKTTERVNINDNGSQASGVGGHSSMAYISANGRYVAFQSWATKLVWGDGNDNLDIFIRDRVVNKTTKLVSRNEQGTLGNDESTDAAISADGNYIAFQSRADNFVPGDTDGTFNGDTNGVFDIFVAPIK